VESSFCQGMACGLGLAKWQLKERPKGAISFVTPLAKLLILLGERAFSKPPPSASRPPLRRRECIENQRGICSRFSPAAQFPIWFPVSSRLLQPTQSMISPISLLRCHSARVRAVYASLIFPCALIGASRNRYIHSRRARRGTCEAFNVLPIATLLSTASRKMRSVRAIPSSRA